MRKNVRPAAHAFPGVSIIVSQSTVDGRLSAGAERTTITLIGPGPAGKSTVGALLDERLAILSSIWINSSKLEPETSAGISTRAVDLLHQHPVDPAVPIEVALSRDVAGGGWLGGREAGILPIRFAAVCGCLPCAANGF